MDPTGPAGQITLAGVVHAPFAIATVRFYPSDEKHGHVTILGRCHWQMSPDRAIRAAQAAGEPSMRAHHSTNECQPYFAAAVRPLVSAVKNRVKFISEVDGAELDALIGRASALLVPALWEKQLWSVTSDGFGAALSVPNARPRVGAGTGCRRG